MSRRHLSRPPFLALVVALALSAAGCGSGGGTSSGTTALAGGFIAQLGAACRADVAGIKAAPKTVAGEAPVQARFIKTLLAIKPTAALKTTFTQYVSLLQQNLAAFEHHDTAAGKRLRTEIAPALDKLRKAGVKGC